MAVTNLDTLSAEQLRALQQSLTPRTNKFIPVDPTPKQSAFLLCNNVKEVLYGGAAGGGKSVALLVAALQYVDVPNYSAILFRKTFSDLMLPGALIPMSQDWLTPWVDRGLVKWKDKEKQWVFLETGATLQFGYLDALNDHLRYQGAEFQFIGMDEATHINPDSYTYMFSRMRRSKKILAPLRFRASANPGGVYGDYYYNRFFVDNEEKKRLFISAGLKDNPHLDAEEYRESLAELDDITRAQLEDGNWEIRAKGDLFEKNWIIGIPAEGIPEYARFVRFWDLAGIDPLKRKSNTNKKAPDWTVGFKLGYANGMYFVSDIIKCQKSPAEVEELITATALADGPRCAIRMEQEPGASGIQTIDHYSRVVLPFYDFAGILPSGSKYERARQASTACQVGNVFINNRCRCLTDFYSQLDSFPNGANDDIVDGFSGAFNYFKPNLASQGIPPKFKEEVSYWRSN